MKNILLIIDMQQGFIRSTRMESLVDKVGALLKGSLFDSVIATRFINADHSVYEEILGWTRLKSEQDQRLCPQIEANADVIFDKYIYNCVNSNFLQRLRQLNNGSVPERVFLAGTDTDCCVLIAATSLFEVGIRPIVLSNYCNSNGGPQSHEAGIRCMERLIGAAQLFPGDLNSRYQLENL